MHLISLFGQVGCDSVSRVRASEHLIYLHVTLQQLLCCPSYSAAFLALLALAFLSSFSYRISNAYDVERPIDDPSLFFFPYLQRFFFINDQIQTPQTNLIRGS